MAESFGQPAHTLPPGFTPAEFAQSRYVATAASSSTYDSGSGSEAGTPSECDTPVTDQVAHAPHSRSPASDRATAGRAPASTHTSAAFGAMSAGSHPNGSLLPPPVSLARAPSPLQPLPGSSPPFMAPGVRQAHRPSMQVGVVSSEPDVNLLDSLFTVLQPGPIDGYSGVKSSGGMVGVSRGPGPHPSTDRPEQLERFLSHAGDGAGPGVTSGGHDGAGGGGAGAHLQHLLRPPMLDMYGQDLSPLGYFGGPMPVPTPGPSVLSPLFAPSPAAGTYMAPLFSPTTAGTMPPFSPAHPG